MTADLVLAAHNWPTNAHLIRDVARLGYLDGHVLDPTYGRGGWWKLWKPDQLTCCDLRTHPTGYDFRDLPYEDERFDAVAFDPPYVAPGGRTTSTIRPTHDRYGQHETPATPQLLFEYNTLGFIECVRVTKPGGFVIYKSKDYVTSGAVQWVTQWIVDDAALRGLALVDRFEHIGTPGQQSQTRQVHARRNLSTLLVFRKHP